MRAWIATAALLLMACSPPAATTSAGSASTQQTTENGCAASANGPWQGGRDVFVVEASTEGADCAHANATLVVKDPQGHELLRQTHPASQVMLLAQAHDVAAMTAALEQWVVWDNHTMQSASALPAWPANASGPQNGEFPFTPEAGLTRAAYTTLRQHNVPLYCYVQGMESAGCFAWEGGRFTKVGVQSFPG
jgi:hypothetical protein